MDNKIDNVPELTLSYIKQFVRDTEEDIVYNPNKPETRLKNYPLFYFADYKNNVFLAYNKSLINQETINKYTYGEEYGCLYLLSNTKRSISYDVTNVNFTRLFSCVLDKVGYGSGSLIECY